MSTLLSDDDLIHALAVLHGAELEKYNTARHMRRVEDHIEVLTAERDEFRSTAAVYSGMVGQSRKQVDELRAERDALAEKLRAVTDQAAGYVLAGYPLRSQPDRLYFDTSYIFPTLERAPQLKRSDDYDVDACACGDIECDGRCEE